MIDKFFDILATMTENARSILISILVLIVVVMGIIPVFWWSNTPDLIDVREVAKKHAPIVVVGTTSSATMVEMTDLLLNKGGGYLRNDIMPPSSLFGFARIMDNMPNWEFGVVVQLRDFSRALRNDIGRSQSQSNEDKDLADADPKYSFDASSWFPPAESEYNGAMEAMKRYMLRLSDADPNDGQFYARADNLAAWLELVDKRLGGLSQKLKGSVGQDVINTDLAGDPAAVQTKKAPKEVAVKTPWIDIDDVFWEARGATWALTNLFRAIEVDFKDVLEDKNAMVSVRQIIRELEASQQPMKSAYIMNGSGFGWTANYSLVMSNYITSANKAVSDLRDLLNRG